MAKFKDLTGQKFGRLQVIERGEDHILPSGKPRTQWVCRCDCGKFVLVAGQGLTQGTTLSCGCYHQQTFKKPINDMTGMRFGKLTVLEYSHTKVTDTNQHKIYWKCLCDCGNITTVEGYQLRVGKTQSCGCIKSRGEELIAKVLNDNSVEFLQNKRVDGLVTPKGGYPIVDFQLFRDSELVAFVEMQGVQHYLTDGVYSTFGEYERDVTDPLKREFCKCNGIFMFEIKYDDNIEEEATKIVDMLYVNPVPRLSNE